MRNTRCLVMASCGLAAAVALVALTAGCGGGNGPVSTPSQPPPPTGGGSQLTLSLSSTLDDAVSGSALATSITSAQLLNTSGAVVKTATVTGGAAQFDITGLAGGDYFIEVNNQADALVPTYIDGTTATVAETVGQKLRTAVIGSTTDPTYEFVTFPKAQSLHAVVKYSDGTLAPPERYSYEMLWLKSSPERIQTKVLGTAVRLAEFDPSSNNHPTGQTIAVWMAGAANHGVALAQGQGCGCHGDLNSHPASYASTGISNGWCYRCHYGPSGVNNGMVDPAL